MTNPAMVLSAAVLAGFLGAIPVLAGEVAQIDVGTAAEATSNPQTDSDETCRMVTPTGSHLAIELCTTPVERIQMREDALETLGNIYGHPV